MVSLALTCWKHNVRIWTNQSEARCQLTVVTRATRVKWGGEVSIVEVYGSVVRLDVVYACIKNTTDIVRLHIYIERETLINMVLWQIHHTHSVETV